MSLLEKEQCPERIRHGGGGHLDHPEVGCVHCGARVYASWPDLTEANIVIPKDTYIASMENHRDAAQRAAKFNAPIIEARHYQAIDALAKGLLAERYDPDPPVAL